MATWRDSNTDLVVETASYMPCYDSDENLASISKLLLLLAALPDAYVDFDAAEDGGIWAMPNFSAPSGLLFRLSTDVKTNKDSSYVVADEFAADRNAAQFW